MSKSRLSLKLSVCELIHQLDAKACLDVIRSIHREFDCQNLNQLLIKMILKLTETTTTNSLNKMKKTINSIIASTNSKHNNVNNNCDNNTKQTAQRSHNNNYSRLPRLPIDLITKTSLYLNEKDIFNFEKCCHLFYQIINNSSYLNQSNTFKTFILTSKTLDQMTQTKNSFYKYSKATTLVVPQFDPSNHEKMERQFEKAKMIGSYDNWLSSMFKSIKTLDVSLDGSPLLSLLPIELMFDPIKSNLERFEIFVDYHDNVLQYFDQFRKKYLALKEKKVLKCVKWDRLYACGILSDLFCIESEHVELIAPYIQLNSKDFKKNSDVRINSNSRLRIVTFNVVCDIDFENENKNKNALQLRTTEWQTIETLRFINLIYSNDIKLLYNEKLIDSLNLDNSVKQLTLHVMFGDIKNATKRQRWENIFSSLLTKEYFFNLEKMNILFDFEYKSSNQNSVVDWMVNILKRNKNTLKHQFNQLNIGFRGTHSQNKRVRCDILQWNSRINDKFLDKFQAKWRKTNQTDTERETNDKIYFALKNK